MTKEEALIRKLEFTCGVIRGVSTTCSDDQSDALMDALDSIGEVIDALDDIQKE